MCAEPNKEDLTKICETIKEITQAATPRGQIARLKSDAERLNAGLDALGKAKELIDERGYVSKSNLYKFNSYILMAAHQIDLAEIGETIIPKAFVRIKQLHSPKNKKQKEILAHCEKLMRSKPSSSAAHLFSRFPIQEKAVTINGVKIFKVGDDKLDCEDPGICYVLPNGKKGFIRERAFANYFSEVKKIRNFER
jgi:hypothetical protein